MRLLESLTRLQRTVWWNHAFQVGAGLMLWIAGATLFAGTLDYWLRPTDSLSRWVLPGVILAGVCRLIWQSGCFDRSRVISPILLGQKLEAEQPQLADRLASGAAFSTGAFAPGIGSVELQKLAVEQAVVRLPKQPVDAVINRPQTQRLVMYATALIVLCGALAMLRPTLARTGMARIYAPWMGVEWPQFVRLELLVADGDSPRFISSKSMDTPPFTRINAIDVGTALRSDNVPRQVLLGSSIDFFVYNARGALPEDVRLELTTNEPTPRTPPILADLALEMPPQATIASLPPQQIFAWETNGRVFGKTIDVASFRLPVTSARLWFRMAGGDHLSMPWRLIEGIEPVRLKSFQLRLEPPAYLSQPVQELPADVGSFEAPVGTRIFFSGLATRPAKSARLIFADGKSLKLRIEADGRQITGVFPVTQPGAGSWAIEVLDATGIREREPVRYPFRVIADQTPTVQLEQPEVDLTVTAQALIPLVAMARDDRGLTQMGFAYRMNGSTAWETIDSWKSMVADETNRPSSAESELRTGDALTGEPILQRSLESVFDLGDLSLPDAATQEVRLSLVAFARDGFQLGTTLDQRGGEEKSHEGRSTLRWITVLSPAQKQQELAERALVQVEELRKLQERVEQNQQQARIWEEAARTAANSQGEKAASDQVARDEHWRQLANTSQQVKSQLGEGIRRKFERLRQEGIQSQVADPAQEGQWQAIDSSLEKLANGPLAKLEELTKSNPAASGHQDEAELSGVAQAIRDEQQQVIDQTGSLIASLGQWEGQRGLKRELDALVGKQEELHQETAQLEAETIARGQMELSADQKSRLSTLRDRQRAIAGRIDQWRKSLGELQRGEALGDRSDQRSLEASADAFDESAIGEMARDAAERLAENQLGKATQRQREVGAAFERLRKELHQAAPEANDELLKQIQELEGDIREELIKSRGDEAAESMDEVERLERKARDEELAERTERLGLRRAAETLERAAELSQRSARAAGADASDGASSESERTEELTLRRQQEEERAQLLEQASREIARERQMLQEKLLSEKFEELRDQLKGLADRQTALHAEIVRLAEIGGSTGKFSRAQLKTLLGLADAAAALQSEVQGLAESLAAAEAFSWAISQIAGQIGEVVEALRERDVEPLARIRSELVMKRIAALRKVLDDVRAAEQAAAGGGGEQTQNERNEESAGSGRAGELLPKSAELRLLKDLQSDLLERTKALEAQGGSDDTGAARESLIKEQAQLRNLLLNLLADFAERAEKQPGDGPVPSDDSGQRPVEGEGR
ncbi:MAG: hypothetical protein C0478_16675 [Planctomyces sp.]|nr:hypothetical protein [Planctomyces sp.]